MRKMKVMPPGLSSGFRERRMALPWKRSYGINQSEAFSFYQVAGSYLPASFFVRRKMRELTLSMFADESGEQNGKSK